MKPIQQRLLIVFAALFLTSAPLYADEADDRIEKSAENSYVFKKYLKDDAVQVSSKDGVVTLTGTVTQNNHKTLAEETVSSLPGVKSVDNKLNIKGEGEGVAEQTDGWLALKVKTALFFHRDVNAFKTKVDAKEGVVTITGEAANQAQKDLVTEYAKDIDGVKDVKNDMTVVDRDKADDKVKEVREDAKEEVNQAKDEARKAKEEAREAKANAARDDADRKDADRDDMDDDDADEKVDDASISAQAKMTLMFHRSTSGLRTKVQAEDGVVTLTGTAKSSAEKELATKLVSDVRGVKRVVNNMDVKNE
jgi:hyperosmotically inducible periplasmic protein